MEDLLQDLRYSIRRLIRTPVFSLGVVLCLALSIGAGSALFLFVDGILLRALPVEDPDRLVWLAPVDSSSQEFDSCSYPDYLDYRESPEIFSGVLAYSGIQLSLRTEDTTDLAQGQVVSPNYFSVLGAAPQIGRGFGDLEESSEEPVLVLSHALWQRRFGGDPQILGRTLHLNSLPFTVIGVAPQGFRGTQYLSGNHDFWLPLSVLPQLRPGFDRFERRGSRWLEVIARLAPDATEEQASQAMAALSKHLAETYPESNEGTQITLFPLDEGHPQGRRSRVDLSIALLTIAGLIFLLAGTNVAGLLVLRAHARRREIGIRLAMGAERPRLIRQLLTENLLLFFLGGLLSVVFALWASRFLSTYEPPDLGPVGLDFSIDFGILAFTFLASLGPGLLFGLLPILRVSGTRPAAVLRSDSRAAGGGSRSPWLRNLFVVAQIAISMLLLIAAGLMVQSLRNQLAVDVGFEGSKTLMATIRVERTAYEPDEAQELFRALLDRLRQEPEIRAASLATTMPLGSGSDALGFYIDGHEPPPNRDTFPIDISLVRSGFFESLGIPLIRGRDFGPQDDESSAVILINEAMANRFYPGEDPVGKILLSSASDPPFPFEIIGVVANSKYSSLEETPKPYIFLSHDQSPWMGSLTLLVRGERSVEGLETIVRETLRQLDRDMPLYDVSTPNQLVENAMMPTRLGATLLSLWSLLGLSLAAIGIYSVVSYEVLHRTFELCMRTALGARPRQIVFLIFKQGMTLFGAGALLGIVLAFNGASLIESYLFGIEANSWTIYLQSTLVFALVAGLASLVPALRTLSLDPLEGLQRD